MTAIKDLWNWWEDYTTKYIVEDLWFKILERNYFTRYWEIDIIAKDWEEIVFIEVKTRKNNNYWIAIESISNTKIKKIIASLNIYLHTNKQEDSLYRVDIATIDYIDKQWKFKLHKNILC